MPSKRQFRVAEQIQEILSELFQFEIEDPRLQTVTVMEVTIDRELMYARVFVNSLGGEEDREDVMLALERASGYLRRELGKRIRILHTPELRFEWDESLAYADRIDQLLDSLTTPSADDESDSDDD